MDTVPVSPRTKTLQRLQRDLRSLLRKRWVLLTLAIFAVSLPGAVRLGGYLLEQNCHQTYSLLNPLRRCGTDFLSKREYEAFKDALVERLSSIKELENIEVALYFRDLQAGPWFGINEDLEFIPASLTKVPTMLVLLKLAEQHPEILAQKIGLNDPPPVAPSVAPNDIDRTLVVGEAYLVEEILRRSIVFSDNFSDFLLRVFLEQLMGSPDFLLRSFRDIGFAGPNATVLTLSVKEYSSIFRLLYNGQFLNREMSQKALDLLSQSEYQAGLHALLPPETTIAHKFGYYEGGKDHKQLLQLHDCGIIYHPQTPYTLCVMTRGKDIQAMTQIIADLSKIIYDEVTARAEP